MPITGGGGNVVDWGLLTALQGVDDWQQKRLDRNAELNQAKQLRDLAEQQRQQQQEAGDKVFNIYNEVAKLKVLPPDTEKIRVKNDELINPIINGIKKYGGDVNLYLQSGGYNDLVKYNQDLQGSNEVVSALRRAKDSADLQNDVKAGKIIRPVYQDVNGSKQKLNPQDELSAFLDGKKDDFQYRGGFDPFKFDFRDAFSKTYANKERKYAEATREDVVNMGLTAAKEKGMNKDDALYYAEVVADIYKEGIDNGNLTPYIYKFDNPLDDQVKQSILDKNKATTNYTNARTNKINSGGGDGGENDPYWIRSIMGGGEVAKYATGELMNVDSGYGKVVNTEYIEAKQGLPYIEGITGTPKRIIKLTFNSSDKGETTKSFDLSDPKQLAELNSLHAFGRVSKTYPDREQEYLDASGNTSVKTYRKETQTTKEQTYTIKGKTYTLKELNELGYNEEQVKNYLNK
jgi:hypothetical protein